MAENAEPGLMERLDNAGLEDAGLLEEIQQMAMVRASVVKVNLSGLAFSLHTPVIDKLKALRQMVYTLAPNFINMDYPYWDLTWVKFPQMFCVATHHGQGSWDPDTVDEIGNDEEHNLNVLPQFGSSFDDESIAIYRKFLKNLVYWLQKFRYIVSKQTAYDMRYKRTWQTRTDWDDWDWQYELLSLRINGQSYTDPIPISTLKSSNEGVQQDYYPPSSFIKESISVEGREFRNSDKTFTYRSRWSDIPLTEIDPYTDNYGYEISGVPGNLTTNNPTGLPVTLSWFIVPSAGGRNAKGNPVKKELNEYIVTQTKKSHQETWGSQSQYTEWSYSATAATDMHSDYESHRDSFKETSYEMEGETRYQKRVTNWSEDGERSAVVESEDHPIEPWTPHSSQSDRTEKRFVYPNFGLTTLQEGVRPCFEAGVIQPHASLTYHVCDQSSLINPGLSEIVSQYVGQDQFKWGITLWSSIDLSFTTRWVPVLDFGDFTIPDPEEEEGNS